MKYESTEPSLTLYKGFNTPKPINYVSMDDVLRYIKSSAFKEASEEIRDTYAREKTPNEFKAEIEMLKKKLGGVGFNGKFGHRNNSRLKESSGLAVLDFDNGPCPKELDPYVLLKYKSPRGKDKVVVRIPLVKDDLQYKEYFRAIQYFVIKAVFGDVAEKDVEKAIKKFQSPLDNSGCDISRFTYLSYDPDPYYNPDATIWVERFIAPVKVAGKIMKEPERSQAGPLKTLQELFYSYSAKNATRHETCKRLGRLAGGWVAGGLLNKDEVFTVAHNAIYTINDGDEEGAKDDLRTFNDMFLIGMQMPMNEYHEKNTIKKVKADAPEVKIVSNEDERIQKALQAQKWEEGEGFLTGWDTFDQHYKIFPRTSTLIYSQPNVGKTLWLFTLMVWMSKTYGWKWFVYSPETGREGTIALRIAEVYTGKDATRQYQMTQEELIEALKWVHEHFFIYERAPQAARPSVDDILQASDKFTLETGIKINGVIIDTLSNTTIESGEKFSRIDLAYENMLDSLGQWMFDHDAHVFLTSHMINVGHIAVDKATGHLIDPTPNFTMIKGGQALPRMGFNVIALHQHRPATFQPNDTPLDYNGNLYYNNSFYAIIQKIKPFYTGRRGMIHFRVDYKNHRIFDADAQSPYVAPAPVRDPTSSAVQQENITYKLPTDVPEWAQDLGL